MKILRWLLGHSFLILLIAAVIYGYMFWGNLAGENTPAGKAITYLSNEFVEVEEFVNAIKEKQTQLSEKSSSETDETAVAANTVDTDTPPTETVNSIVEQQPASIVSSNSHLHEQQNSAAVIESDAEKSHEDKADTASSEVDHNNDLSLLNTQQKTTVNNTQLAANAAAIENVKEKFISPEIEKQLGNVDDHGRVIDESLQNDMIRTSWITARKAFYQRNYELSEQSYQTVIDNTKDNFDAYGELGNVYFNQGKRKQAASAYFEAAAILVRKGQANRARSLIGLLRHLDKEKADKLQQLIESTPS